MQGGQPDPGRGVYVARRIVAALVILLLIVLIVPRACEALFSERDSGARAPETASMGEDTTTEQASIPADSSPDNSGADEGATGGNAAAISDGAKADGGGNEELPNIEVAADLTGVVAGLEAARGGGDIVGSAPPPALAPSTEVQQAAQPVSQQPVPEPPVQPVAQQQAAQPMPEPPVPEPPVQPVAQQQATQPIPQQSVQPIPFEEPIFFGQPSFFEEPSSFGNRMVSQEPPPSGAVNIATVNDAAVVADSGGAVAATGPVVALS